MQMSGAYQWTVTKHRLLHHNTNNRERKMIVGILVLFTKKRRHFHAENNPIGCDNAGFEVD